MSAGAIVFGAVFVLIGAGLGWAGAKKFGEAYRIHRNEPVSVREASRETGVDEFEGVVRPVDGEVFDAPFSGAPAVLSTYEVERRERRSGSSRSSRNRWRTETTGTIRRPFLVEDETGAVLVDPEGAAVDPADEPVEERTGGSLPEAVRLRLSTLTDELDLADVLAQEKSRTRRYSEGHIGPGDEVHVYGTQVAERTPERRDVDARVESAPDERLFRITAGDEATAIRNAVGAGMVFLLAAIIFGGSGVLVVSAGLG